jgi:hypothetical protein
MQSITTNDNICFKAFMVANSLLMLISTARMGGREETRHLAIEQD